MSTAVQKKEEAEQSKGYYVKQLSEVRQLCDVQNWRFENCFDHAFKEWDGSRAMIDQWLQEKDTKETDQGYELFPYSICIWTKEGRNLCFSSSICIT